MPELHEASDVINGHPPMPSTPTTKSNISKFDDDDPLLKTPPSSRKLQGLLDSPTNLNNYNKSFLSPSTPSSSKNYDSLSNVPSTPHSSNVNNRHLSFSPLKSPSASSSLDDDDNKPPIRQISNTLKTRLSYAFVKYQKGWSNQSLDELEKNIENRDHSSSMSSSPFNTGKLKSTRIGALSPSSSSSKISKPLRSPTKPSFINGVNLSHKFDDLTDEEEGDIHSGRLTEDENDNDGSAKIAFLHAISKQTSPKRKAFQVSNNHILTTPKLRLDQSSLNNAYNPEADAIESLMSLSSPKYSQHNYHSDSNSPKRVSSHLDLGVNSSALPQERLSFGGNLNHDVNHNSKPIPSSQKLNDDDNFDDAQTETEETEDDITDDERSTDT